MQLFLSDDFNIRTLRKTPKAASLKIKDWQDKLRAHHLTSLGQILSAYIPQRLFNEQARIDKTRRRIFSTENTFWGFFMQTLQADGSCQAIVHQFRVLAHHQSKDISASTSAYCQARKRLSMDLLKRIFEHTTRPKQDDHPLVKRRVVCADGTGLLAADSAVNQEAWPQQATQKSVVDFLNYVSVDSSIYIPVLP